MKAEQFLEAIAKHDPCQDAVDWAKETKSLAELWRTCERGDWMLWIAAKLDIDRKIIVAVACDCAELALKYVPKGEKRPKKAIEIARKWVKGKATLKEVRASAAASSYAYAYASAYASASAASYAAAAASSYASASASAAASRTKTYKKCAAITRKYIKSKDIENAIKNQNK